MSRTHKASFSTSPLAFSRSPIHLLAKRLQEYLHLPDPYPLYTLMASLVANYAQGRPVWLMLIGPPSCGKSELLSSLLSLPNVKEGGSITGIGALLSGTRKKERSADSTGGILHEIGARGALVIKEFTSIISLPPETMRQVMGAFREVYDGRYTRSTGSDGGTDQHWEGKLALLTGCTEAIDHHHQLISDMGERFLFYRYESSDGWSEAYKALSVSNPETLSETLQALLNQFVTDLELSWSNPLILPDLDSHEKQRIIAFAQFTARGRSAVIRDGYTKEVTQASSGEYPTRIAIALSQVLKSLRHIGVSDAESWVIIRKMAFDSIPGTRRLALSAILSGASRVSEISDVARVSQSTVRRALEELDIHGLASKTENTWGLSTWARARLVEACNGTTALSTRLVS